MLISGCKKVPWKLIVDGIILTLIMKKNKRLLDADTNK